MQNDMTDKFPRRNLFKKILENIGETSVDSLRSYHLADEVSSEKVQSQTKVRQTQANPLSKARPRPKKST